MESYIRMLLAGAIAWAIFCVINPDEFLEFIQWATFGTLLTFLFFLPIAKSIAAGRLRIEEITSFFVGFILLLMLHFYMMHGDAIATLSYILEWIIVYAVISTFIRVIVRIMENFTP